MKRIILFIFIYILIDSAFAVDQLALQLNSIEGSGWQLKNVVLHLQTTPRQEIALQIQIGALTFSGLKTPLEQLHLICQKGSYTVQKVICSDGRLKIAHDLFDKPEIKIEFTYYFQQQRLILNIKQLALAEGQITLKMEVTPKDGQVTLKIQQMQMALFLEKLSHFIILPPLPHLKGRVTTTVKFSSHATTSTINMTGKLTEFSFSNTESTQAGENIAVQFTFDAHHQQEIWQIQSSLAIQQGEIYVDPIYIAFTKDHSLNITTKMVWQKNQLVIQNLSYIHDQILNLQGNGTLQLVPNFKIIALIVQLQPTELKKFYTHYLKSWLSSGLFGNLDLAGTLAGKLDWQSDRIHLRMELEQITIEDGQKRFGLKECYGTIQWHSHATDLNSQLYWSSAYIASQINLGKSHLTARLTGRQFELLQPWQQPLLNGTVRIEKLFMSQIGQDRPQFELKGEITPISMQAISKALNLPLLNGSISGQIPSTRYDNNQLEVDGELLIQVFDGKVAVRSLRVKNLFKQPELLADIDVDKLNLKTLTNMTEFGQIQGHLSGWIRELHLIHWQPVSFDAYFATPTDNTLPRKISQKAVNNLSNLGGGGMVNAISRGILNLFEEFSYQSIGMGCRLHQGVCDLKGLEPVQGGYYIVKGSGLPRIDIIGYNQKINWNELLTRLKAASRASHPVIK
ncbi:MAG: hypothetical protein BWK79_09825 [Beggiatoa sp. IS2]|nr:MAG: hypothetical protein BWK79_09825 [Beggiatoa sp. IS2]